MQNRTQRDTFIVSANSFQMWASGLNSSLYLNHYKMVPCWKSTISYPFLYLFYIFHQWSLRLLLVAWPHEAPVWYHLMSQWVNISACPFHRYTYGPHTRPLRRAADHPSLRSPHSLGRQKLPTYISSSERSGRPHDLLFEEDPVDIPEAGQAQSNYTPGKTRRICWTWVEILFLFFGRL